MSIEEGPYVSAVFTHFDPNEALYDFNTIILKPKKRSSKRIRKPSVTRVKRWKVSLRYKVGKILDS